MLDLLVDVVLENAEPRKWRLPEWPGDALAEDSRLEFALPSPRVPLEDSTRRLGWEWNGADRSFDAVLATAQRIPTEFRYVLGATTVESSIEDLLAGGAGVRQDFTHLFLALLRGAGWPARYVSGTSARSVTRRSSRVSPMPGSRCAGRTAGWVGLDPTQGNCAGAEHLRLAVGRDYGDVAPHHGLFYGTARGAPPEVSVHLPRCHTSRCRVSSGGQRCIGSRSSSNA